jgi:trk system potassium uptake protein TrkA
LRRGAAEALELIAHGDYKSSRVVGRRIEEINLPKGATIGAIVRRFERPAGEHVELDASTRDVNVIMAHHDTVIETDDHVIVFVVNKGIVSKVESLFQVDVGFL